MQRRTFLTRSLVGSSIVLSGPSFWRSAYADPAQPGPGPYGSIASGEPDDLGIVLPEGFTARLLATSGQVVAGTSYEWHAFPDGGACFEHPEGGWVYASNSEVDGGGGGVGALRFDADGEVVDAYRLLGGSSRNCGGGPTPSGTWLSGEEVDDGVVWECDPQRPGSGTPRPSLGRFRHEAAAVDHEGQAVYLTEDQPDGRLYRFVPDEYPHLTDGVLSAARVDDDGSVTWEVVPDPGAADQPTRLQGVGTPFDGGEGIWFDDGIVYFTSKGDNRVRMVDVEASTLEVLYDAATLADAPLTGVDNITRSASGDLYVCEDGGNMELVLISPEREVAPFLRFVDQDSSELAGVAFSPDGSRLYVSSQRGGGGSGATYEIAGPFRAPPEEPAGGGTTTTLGALAEAPGEAVGDHVDGDDRDPSTVLGGAAVGVAVVAAAVGGAVALRRRQRTSAPGPPPTDGPGGTGS